MIGRLGYKEKAMKFQITSTGNDVCGPLRHAGLTAEWVKDAQIRGMGTGTGGNADGSYGGHRVSTVKTEAANIGMVLSALANATGSVHVLDERGVSMLAASGYGRDEGFYWHLYGDLESQDVLGVRAWGRAEWTIHCRVFGDIESIISQRKPESQTVSLLVDLLLKVNKESPRESQYVRRALRKIAGDGVVTYRGDDYDNTIKPAGREGFEVAENYTDEAAKSLHTWYPTLARARAALAVLSNGEFSESSLSADLSPEGAQFGSRAWIVPVDAEGREIPAKG